MCSPLSNQTLGFVLSCSTHPNTLQNRSPSIPLPRDRWEAVLQHMEEHHPAEGAAWQALQGSSKLFSC